MFDLLKLLKRYPVQLITALALLPIGVIAFTAGAGTLVYPHNLQRITAQANEWTLRSCDGSEIAARSTPADIDCLQVVPIDDKDRQVDITYYSHEPKFDLLLQVDGSGEELTIWYAPRESTVLFTRLGTLRAARLGTEYLVDTVSTFLERRRLGARSTTLGLFILFVLIPALLWRPTAQYLQSRQTD